MKRVNKITVWIAGSIVLLAICLIGYIKFGDNLKPGFEETKIYPDENRVAPSDTIFNVNGTMIKMIGIKGGKIDCRGLKKTIELDNFYISETEVTQGLWTAIMGDNPSMLNIGDSLPVENVDLIDCLNFVHRLDSITGMSFVIPSYPEWLYVANLGTPQTDRETLDNMAWHKDNSGNTTHVVKQKKPDNLGVYDVFGNVAEWTRSGSDPLFIVAGGSFVDEMDKLDADFQEFDHGKVKMPTIGFRLVLYSSKPKR